MSLLARKFNGGAAVPHRKNTRDKATIVMPVPQKIVIPMLQHIGAPCTPIVKKGDRVKVGQKIGDSEAFVSSPVHSSVSGTVLDVSPMLYPGGFDVMTVQIEPDGLQELDEQIKAPGMLEKSELLKAIRNSGIVGLGGAGFPTHIKLSPPPGKEIDTVIINGAECEPYITSDYREMLENTENILKGIRILLEITGAGKAFIGIESNKPEAIARFKERIGSDGKISVIVLPCIYPQGAEKQLIYSATGRKVPSGGLPSDVGALVQNLNTASFLANFMDTGMPLIKRKVTVDGSAVAEPANVEVLIGTPLKDVFAFCGGFKEEPRKVLMGGPMMGISQFSLDTPVVKHTNAILAFNEKDSVIEQESVCIRCGRCVNACPMNLLPLYINAHVNKGNFEETRQYNVNDCIECGSCSYVCPAKRHLVQSIRIAKAELRKIDQAKKK